MGPQAALSQRTPGPAGAVQRSLCSLARRSLFEPGPRRGRPAPRAWPPPFPARRTSSPRSAPSSSRAAPRSRRRSPPGRPPPPRSTLWARRSVAGTRACSTRCSASSTPRSPSRLRAAPARSGRRSPSPAWAATAAAPSRLKSDLDVRRRRSVGSGGEPRRRRACSTRSGTWGSPSATRWSAIDEYIDAARDDLPTATSLLDWRHVAGDAGLLERAPPPRASDRHLRPLRARRFLGRLEDEVAQRHGRFGGSVYLLEPDVKNGAGRPARSRRGALGGAGALRASASRRAGARRRARPARGGRDPRGQRDALARPQPAPRPRRAAQRPAHLRRAGDRSPRSSATARAATRVERLMSAYYRAARTISRSLEMILPAPRPSSAGASPATRTSARACGCSTAASR